MDKSPLSASYGLAKKQIKEYLKNDNNFLDDSLSVSEQEALVDLFSTTIEFLIEVGVDPDPGKLKKEFRSFMTGKIVALTKLTSESAGKCVESILDASGESYDFFKAVKSSRPLLSVPYIGQVTMCFLIWQAVNLLISLNDVWSNCSPIFRKLITPKIQLSAQEQLRRKQEKLIRELEEWQQSSATA